MNHNKFYYITLLLFASALIFKGQKLIDPAKLKSKFAKGENKEKYYANLVKNAELTLSSDYEGNYGIWIKAFRDVQSILLKNKSVENGLEKILSLETDENIKLQRVALEIANTLYKGKYQERIGKIALSTDDKISYAIAVSCLLKDNNRESLIKQTEQKFGINSNSPIIQHLLRDLNNSAGVMPDLGELLNHEFQENCTIIFSFHRKNRIFPGITIVRKPDGEFVRNEKGEIFRIPQLAASFSNLPGYIPNGNTPQGIYSIQGTYISPTETIGPTPNVLTRIPFEVAPETFYHSPAQTKNWKLEEYEKLLPFSWRNYKPIYNSYYAGKIGRKLIIIHGSTDEIKYFSEQPYYPLTPTRGCLSSKEIWDSKSGRLIESDQVKLINAFRSAGQNKGYLFVVEINDKRSAVEIEEILEYLE